MDIVVNILPLTDETHHLFDAKFFKQMKNDAWFINVGRGASVNTNDLLEALRHQELAFAGLDVLEEEPLDQHHPIWSEPNVLITPHILWKFKLLCRPTYRFIYTKLSLLYERWDCLRKCCQSNRRILNKKDVQKCTSFFIPYRSKLVHPLFHRNQRISRNH